jgi:simple sugar transport system substrate-binding protein
MWNPKQAGEVFVTMADRLIKGESIKEGDEVEGLGVIQPAGNDIIVDQLLAINKDTVDELAAMGL